MKSDISRQTFNRRKHYSKVIMQQGRVQIDADWNELQDIQAHRGETQARDMIGPSGAPLSGGFEVTFTPDGSDLVISPGSMYVDGILCELEPEAAVAVQSITDGRISVDRAELDNPGPSKLKNRWVELLDENGQLWSDEKCPNLVKITDVNIHKDTVSLSTDQPDFTLPDEEAAGLELRPVLTYLTQPNYDPQQDPGMRDQPMPGEPNANHVFLAYLDVWQRQITVLDDPGIREVALGGADTAQRSQTLWQVKVVPIELSTRKRISSELEDMIERDTGKLLAAEREELKENLGRLLRILTFTPGHCDIPAPSYNGKLSVRLTPTNGRDSGVYRGENQLYHIEIHQGNDDVAIPTFKWARNNASSLVAARIEDGKVTIPGSGQGSLLGVGVGQFVELVNDQTELHALPGHLAQIKRVDDITGQLALDPPPPRDLEQIKLRLWDGAGAIDGSQGVNISEEGWIALTALGMANGIEVQFTQDGTYRSGDYWLIPARAATGKIGWPHTVPQPPIGVQHRYARLACLLHSKTIPLQQDCRTHFFPLASEALHILDINWKNDTFDTKHNRLRERLKDGLKITLDGPPDQACARAMLAAMIVTVETALPGGGAGIFIINGVFEIEDNRIEWHWDREERLGLLPWAISKFDKWLDEWFERRERYLRVRITLKGHYIWRTVNGRRIYLDGQAFGTPGTEVSGHKPIPGEEPGKHIYLQFPSGAGQVASDFESWFYMKE